MYLSNPSLLPVLLTILLSTTASPLSPDHDSALAIPAPPTLHPRTSTLHPDTLSTSARFTMGPFHVFLLKSIAVLPVQLAAADLADFFTVVAQTGHVQKLSGRVTDHYDFGFGAIKMFLNTLPGSPGEAAPPLDWDLVMWIGSQLAEMTRLGWTEHFAGVFVDPGSRVQTFVTLQVVAAGLATVGFVDVESGRPSVPAADYFMGSR